MQSAGDEESWTLFKDIMNPIIKGWHGFDPERDFHPTDLDPTHLKFGAEDKALFDKYVVSTRIRAARNIKGYSLPSGTDEADRAAVEVARRDVQWDRVATGHGMKGTKITPTPRLWRWAVSMVLSREYGFGAEDSSVGQTDQKYVLTFG